MAFEINRHNSKEQGDKLTQILRNLNDKEKLAGVTLALAFFNADERAARIIYETSLDIAYKQLNDRIKIEMGWE